MNSSASPRPPLWAVAALAACSAVALACAPAQYFGRQQDDLLYVIASQALSHGDYSLFTAVGRPPLVMITPGWPALLLPISIFCPARLGVYEAFCALLAAALPWALFAWFRRSAGDLVGLLIALLCGTSPLFLSQAGTVMSETPYLLLTLALLRALERRGKSAGTAAGWWLLLLTQARPAGLSLLPAAVAGYWRRRDLRALAWACAPTAAGVAAWCAWSYATTRSVQELDELRQSYAGAPLLRPLWVALDNAAFYARTWASAAIPDSWARGGAAAILGSGLLLSALVGCVRALKRRPDDPQAWLLIGAAGLHAVWAWQYERYLIPLLPFLLWAAALAWGRAAKPLLWGLLACQLAFHAPRWLRGTSWRTPELERTYAWLSARMKPDESIASPIYVRDGFYIGRPSLPLPDADTPQAFAEQLRARRARWILWQGRLDVGLSQAKTAAIARRLERAGQRLQDSSLFERVYANAEEQSQVFVLRQ